MSDSRFEREEVRSAQREAGEVGGRRPADAPPASERPVREAGGGESEGFEEAERLLVEHASHADQQAAHAVLHRRGEPEEEQDDDGSGAEPAADHERTAERR